jgi:gamma-glutamyltranspeptidase/glutathione hydrolase
MHPKLKHGMVAAGDAVTAENGAMIIREGGNAVDAAVAALATAFIAEPALTAAGGGGFMLIRDNSGSSTLFDGFSRMPTMRIDSIADADFHAAPVDFGDTVQQFHIGRAAVATPSLPAMLFAAHKQHGRMPIREVLAPAIDAARNGVRLNGMQAGLLHLLRPILMREEESRRLHAADGELPNENEPFRNPDLAALLELLAIEGIDEMYHGDVARAIVAAIQPGGLLTMQDLAGTQYAVRKPLAVPLANGTLLTNPPPSSGGCLIAFAARLLDTLHGHYPNLPFELLMAEALRETSCARGHDFDRNVHRTGMADDFLRPERLKESLAHIRERLKGHGHPPVHEAHSRLGSTTHISVLDRDGMAVSLTSSNGEGSGIVVPGTGLHLNNMLGEADINPLGFHRLPGGAVLSSMMAPGIFVQEGRPALTLGSGGSNRLRGAILQVLIRHLWLQEPIEAAVAAPRIHNEADNLDAEPHALTDELRHHLGTLGWQLREWQQSSMYFGGVHAVALDAKGAVQGAADPRRTGSVALA